ncbi:MAG: DNA repair protein RecN [Proteobacteria bacterium]|nr:DNA repair protein RecN [Pseudomonadota bacterium]
MLKALTIQDLAVVRQLDIEFEAGLTILTGETGAGKSILIEALGLALGDRADSSMVRHSAERASVSATFDIEDNQALQNFLADNHLESGAQCILRRVMNADGRTRAFCNATPVPVQLLKQIGDLLVDIHSQHAHHSLLRRPVQRDLLDEYGQCADALRAVRLSFKNWHDITVQIDELTNGSQDVPSRIDLLRFQAEEIEKLGISADSLATLEAEHRRIGHSAKLIAGCENAHWLVFDDDSSALTRAVKASDALRELSEIDKNLEAVVELLDQAVINLSEAEREFAHVRSNMDADPERLEQLDRQLQLIQDVARKHRCKVHEVPNRLAELRTELDDLCNREDQIQQANLALKVALDDYREKAEKLHASRVQAAKKMAREITHRLRELGIPHADFTVQIDRHTATPSAHGDDEIEFLVTANPDQPVKPLRKVASGGELSRISLAIQVASTGNSGIPVMVFDEVDTGVGGATADVVSKYLQQLAERRQILCITHLPQVASSGSHHYFIGKVISHGVTETTVEILEHDARVEEIARMLGGQKVTSKARDHARELLAH